ALAHPVRRAIVARLSGGGATVGEAGRGPRVPQPTIPRHPKPLEGAGVVNRGGDGPTPPAGPPAGRPSAAGHGVEGRRGGGGGARWERLFDVVGEYLEEQR